MNTEQKNQIRSKLEQYIRRYPSQNKAATSLGISGATLSAIMNGKYESISDDMWMTLRDKVGASTSWQCADTQAFGHLMLYMAAAKVDSSAMWVTGPAGIGKSTAASMYAASNRNVFLLTCSEDMHKSDFVKSLAKLIGVNSVGMTVRETLTTVIETLVTMDHPLLIFDEGDKLTDSVLYYYISLYNGLKDKCGMIFLSTEYMKRRMENGLNRAKKGYDELDSRIGRRFIPLPLIKSNEVATICQINGLEDKSAVATVIKEAAECGNDLRRVRRSIQKEMKKLSLNNL